LHEGAPDHTTISRTRQLIDVEKHRQIFDWILELLADAGLLKTKRIGTTRRRWKRYLKELAQQSGSRRVSLSRLISNYRVPSI
jgi:hypothetical protein